MIAIQTKPARSVGILATLTIVIVLISSTWLMLSLRSRELEHAYKESLSMTHMLMEQTEKNFSSADLVLQGVQERLSSAYGRQLPLDSVPVQLLLNARVAGVKHISSIFVVDETGTLVNSSREARIPRMSLADREYYKVFLQGRPNFAFLDKPTRSRLDDAWSIFLARRLDDPQGNFRGVVVAAITIKDFERSLNMVQLDYVRPVGIYMTDGTTIATFPHRDGIMGKVGPELMGHAMPGQPQQVFTIQRKDEFGQTEVLCVGKIADFPLLLVVKDLENLSLQPWREAAIPIGVGAVLVCVFTGLVAVYLAGKLEHKEALTTQLNSAINRYQHTVDSVMDAIVAVDSTMSIILFNPAAEQMFGRTADSVLGKDLSMLIPERLRPVHTQHMQEFNGTDSSLPRTVVPQRNILGLRADGSEFPIESTFSKSVVNGKLQMTAVLRDATQKRKAELELREANGQLRELTKSLTKVREQERTRISRELHDDLGQQLTGLKLSLSWLANRIKEGRETAAQNVDDMRHQLDAAIVSVRQIASELRPRVLDDLDFAEALEWQTAEFTRHSGLDVKLNLQAGSLIKNNEVATELFRIVQEALTNVVRHAHATQVRIDLVEQGANIILSVRDNGVGFDSSSRKRGVGLVGMRERCTAIGGELGIFSQIDLGTTISVTVPLASAQAQETAA